MIFLLERFPAFRHASMRVELACRSPENVCVRIAGDYRGDGHAQGGNGEAYPWGGCYDNGRRGHWCERRRRWIHPPRNRCRRARRASAACALSATPYGVRPHYWRAAHELAGGCAPALFLHYAPIDDGIPF